MTVASTLGVLCGGLAGVCAGVLLLHRLKLTADAPNDVYVRKGARVGLVVLPLLAVLCIFVIA